MLSLDVVVAGSIVIALNLYMLMGGADYGGGVWDLLASGSRARQQRDLIAHAIGPIWEANHVWLILAITVLFTAFPLAFSTITTFLHLPLLLMLVGIVFRGSAFAFRSFDLPNDRAHARWSLVFSISSLLTPILLGITLGSIASGQLLRRTYSFRNAYIDPWFAPFPMAVGFFALSLFAFLAAVYLTVEAREVELQEDFRLRALWSGALVALMAVIVYVLAGSGAPELRRSMILSRWTGTIQASTAIVAAIAYVALWRRKYQLARVGVVVQSTLVLWGWAIPQFPNMIMPNLSIYEAAAPPSTLRLLVIALIAGTLILVPSFVYLLRIFKTGAERR